MKITLLVFTFNEITGMKQIMPRVKREWVDEIIVVDAGSSDGTAEYARDNGYRVIIQKKRGLRNAYMQALEYVETDAVITFSPDGNSIPELISPLAEKIKEGYDMVIVSRYLKGAKSYDDDAITAFGNWAFTSIINFLFRAKYTDAMVMFRAWRKDIFYELALDKEESYSMEEKLFHTQVGIEPLLSIRAAKRKLRCADIPGDEPLRIGGIRKLQIIKWGAAYFFEAVRELLIR